jgi:integrase
MASYKFEPDRQSARLYWRYLGRHQTKVIRCATDREAQRACSLVEETLDNLVRGRLSIPDGVDPRMFILSGGKAVATPSVSVALAATVSTLAALFESYLAAPPPHLEVSTRKMQEIHFRKLAESARVKSLGSFDRAAAQAYVAARSKMTSCRGGVSRSIHRDTIQKELKTLRQAWAWVASRTPGLDGPQWTLKDLSFPKGRPVRPFLSWGEIEREIRRGGLDDREVDELWDCLWLDRDQVRDLLSHVRDATAPPFLYPMIATAAFTGARRSELCQSRLGDWNLADRKGRLRQKKRDKDVEFSFRDVPVHPALAEVLGDWFARHPGGVYAFAQPDRGEITWGAATHHFRAAIAGSKWQVVKGWHVLRHSFASNLAAQKQDQRLIDAWMGHSTNIRLRYQHLRPDDQADAIGVL